MSDMRRFLDTNGNFRWPREGNITHYDLDGATLLPLDWQRRLGDSADVNARYELEKSVMVKSIRQRGSSEYQKEAQNHARFLETIHHPHCIAYLGFYEQSDQLHILTFPKAQCSLKELMDSTEQQQSKIISNLLKFNGPKGKAEFSDFDLRGSPALSFSYEDRMRILRRCFVCLTQALSWIHEHFLMHKDIDPESILVDGSGSVLLADVGERESLQGSNYALSHVGSAYPSIYASPDLSKGNGEDLGRASDILSLGRVLLEVATLVLRQKLWRLRALSRSPLYNGVELHRDLYLIEWIHVLEKSGPSYKEQADSDAVRDVRMIGALPTIRGMLNEEPKQRPKAHGLWEKFKWVSLEICADCDPRHPDVWRPQELAKCDLANANSSVQPDSDVKQELPDASLFGNLLLSGSSSSTEQPDSSSITEGIGKDVLSLQSILSESKPARTDVMTPINEESTIEDHQSNATNEEFSEDSDGRKVSDFTSAESLSSKSSLTSGRVPTFVTSQEVMATAEELAYLLLQDEDLEPLCAKSLERMEPFKFKKTFMTLLKVFALNLLDEAGNALQSSVAHFVKQNVENVTNFIGQNRKLVQDETYEHTNMLRLQTSQREQIVKEYVQQQLPNVENSQTLANEENDTSLKAKIEIGASLREEVRSKENDDYAIPKSRKRTKIGCLGCRKRKIKCDEERPTCSACVRLKRNCEGYTPSVIFKDTLKAYRPAVDGTHKSGADFWSIKSQSNTFPIESSAPSGTKDVESVEKKPELHGSQADWADRSQVQRLSDVRNFLLNSSAISNLKENLQIFVLDEPDKQQVKEESAFLVLEPSTVHASGEIGKIESSDSDESMDLHEARLLPLEPPMKQPAIVIDNLFRSTFAMITSLAEILELREKALETGYRRIRWTCVCGARLYDDFREITDGSLAQLEDFLNDTGVNQRICESVTPGNGATSTISVTGTNSIQAEQTSQTTQSADSFDADAKEGLRRRGHGQIQTCHEDSSLSKMWILPIFQYERYGTKVKHLSVASDTCDENFFTMVKQRYLEETSRIRRFFALRGVKKISYVKFIHAPREPDIHKFDDWPLHIQQQSLETTSSNEPSPTSGQSSPPSEQENQGPRSSYVFLRTPRKLGEQLQPDDEDPPEAWGLYFEEGFRVHHFFILLLFIYILASLAFAIYWCANFGFTGPKTGSGAFAVSSWMIALFSLVTTVWFKWAD
ncbi:MAG: hypothetical protein Q9195_006472 [Heterodermia aff. obscurata]